MDMYRGRHIDSIDRFADTWVTTSMRLIFFLFCGIQNKQRLSFIYTDLIIAWFAFYNDMNDFA